MPPKKGRGAAAVKGAHQLAEEMPSGEILTDLFKKRFRVVRKLGQGGFGLIYLASKDEDDRLDEPSYVIKQEPLGNGPLALECLFYAGNLKPEKLDAWAKKKRVAQLGLPKFVGWGMHTFRGKSYRFLAMPRFGSDLQKKFEAAGSFDRVSVALLALRLIDSLQYLHDNRYVHADIKAANILLPFSAAKKPMPAKTVYLVDFGLAAKFGTDEAHVTYKQDPKRAHDGTIEFTSRDAHMGVKPSRRGDMEILGYCLVQWLCGRLPWEDKLADKNYVAAQKCSSMKDIPAFLKRCFPKGEQPAEIGKYLHAVNELEYTEEPDYSSLKELFKSFLRSKGVASDAGLNLVTVSTVGEPLAAPATPKRGAAGKKSAPARSSKGKAQAPREKDLTGVDESLSLAFPPKRTPKRRAPRARAAPGSEEEATSSREVGAAASLTAASTSSRMPSFRASRKRVMEEEEEEEDPPEKPQPLREVSQNPPASPRAASRSSPRIAKKLRIVQRRKNVKTSDGATQTTPTVKRARR